MRKYLVSGLSPSMSGGVGILMKHLVPKAIDNGYTVIARRDNKSIHGYIRQSNYLKVAQEYIARLIDGFLFSMRTTLINRSVVLLIHPQSVGYDRSKKLIRRNDVSLYVMDNSFFCIKSYNYHPFEKKECFNCLQDFDLILEPCYPGHSRTAANAMTAALEQLREHSGDLRFLAQNKAQASLLRAFYGEKTDVVVVGLDTGEIHSIPDTDQRGTGFDVVFHGSSSFAKGIEYVVRLAALLPELSFLIPVEKQNVEQLLGYAVSNTNITFRSCSWLSGLRDEVMKAGFVINPSLWSAPIEGAFVKSIAYNGNVITVESEYGYEKETADSYPLLRLPAADITKAAQMLRDARRENRMVKKETILSFLEQFRVSNNINKVFNTVR